ncbi:UNVERIFIED_CONTAM: hypothetical protein FKN15_002491 [Acipenser sinensis]
MERYESWMRGLSTPLWQRPEGRHLLGDSHLDILLDFTRLKPEFRLSIHRPEGRSPSVLGQKGGARASSGQNRGGQASTAQEGGG